MLSSIDDCKRDGAKQRTMAVFRNKVACWQLQVHHFSFGALDWKLGVSLRGLHFCMLPLSLFASPMLRLAACKVCWEHFILRIHSQLKMPGMSKYGIPSSWSGLSFFFLRGQERCCRKLQADDFWRLLPSLNPFASFINKLTAKLAYTLLLLKNPAALGDRAICVYGN